MNKKGLISSRLPLRFAVVGSLLLSVAAGCHIIQTAADVPAQAVRTVTPGAKAEAGVDPVEVQQTLMRFADEFAARMAVGIDKLCRGTNEISRSESLNWKIAFGSATCSIASGPNATANLLDMTVFVSEARMALEEYWQPQVFGESAATMLESCRLAEAEIWRFTGSVLNPEQQATLREALQVWHAKNAQPGNLLIVRAVGLAMQVAKASRADTAKSGNLFSLLMLDPLAELDPARRELAQTRLFAERALFVTQRMPTLLRWQMELLSVDALEQPALRQWATNVTQIASAVDRFSRTAEQLPQQVSAEREALVKALEAQESALRPVLGDANQALTAGTQMSESLNTTLATFNDVLRRLGVGEPDLDASSSTNAQPFRILDYEKTARSLEASAKQLTELLRTFDQTLGANSRSQLAAQLGPVVQQAQAGGKDFVDYVYWKGVLFVAVALLAALLYRVLALFLTRAARSKSELER